MDERFYYMCHVWTVLGAAQEERLVSFFLTHSHDHCSALYRFVKLKTNTKSMRTKEVKSKWKTWLKNNFSENSHISSLFIGHIIFCTWLLFHNYINGQKESKSSFTSLSGVLLPKRQGAQTRAWNLCSNPDGDLIATIFCKLPDWKMFFFRAGPSPRDTESLPSAPDVSFTTNLFHPGAARLSRAGLGRSGSVRLRPSLAFLSAPARLMKMIYTESLDGF